MASEEWDMIPELICGRTDKCAIPLKYVRFESELTSGGNNDRSRQRRGMTSWHARDGFGLPLEDWASSRRTTKQNESAASEAPPTLHMQLAAFRIMCMSTWRFRMAGLVLDARLWPTVISEGDSSMPLGVAGHQSPSPNLGREHFAREPLCVSPLSYCCFQSTTGRTNTDLESAVFSCPPFECTCSRHLPSTKRSSRI